VVPDIAGQLGYPPIYEMSYEEQRLQAKE